MITRGGGGGGGGGVTGESPPGLITSLLNVTCLPHLEGAVACVLRWVGGWGSGVGQGVWGRRYGGGGGSRVH